MNRRWVGMAATMVAMGAGLAWAAHGEAPLPDGKGGRQSPEARQAAILFALGKGDPATAVKDAEAATLLQPRDVAMRALLGRAYLAAGRFRSASTAFADALTLDPSFTHVYVSHALAQIAVGDASGARASLAKAEGVAPDADIALALALLGDIADARQRLDAAARAAGADIRTRQNLGLVYALDGRWIDAAAIAQQDVPADQVPQRLRRWALIAQMKANPAMQIGAILGILPVADQGQPTALALAAPPAAPIEADTSPVKLAVAPVAALAARPVAVPALSLPAVDAAAPVPFVPASVAPAPVAPSDQAAPAARLASFEPAPAGSSGRWMVQLGAFSSLDRRETAWSTFSARAAFLADYAPSGSDYRRGGSLLYRLSVGGLPTRRDAANLCARIKQAKVVCFVRYKVGDQPMRWASQQKPDDKA